jgi:hypothetical protein
MKKFLYILLMMFLSVLGSFFLYLSILTLLARHRIIPLHQLDPVLGMLMGNEAYGLVTILGCLYGYYVGKKWWKIIYIDGVYYFRKPVKKEEK